MYSWMSVGRGAADSLPIGNGHWGANVWTEADGSIALYLGANDSWSENGRLLKVGKLRLSVGEPIALSRVGGGATHRLSLDEENATVRSSIEEGEKRFDAMLWIDANRDVLWIEVETRGFSGRAPAIALACEPWRVARRRVVDEREIHSFVGQSLEHDELWVEPDSVIDDERGIGAVHVNRRSYVPQTLEHQGLGDLDGFAEDPLLGRASGIYLHSPSGESAIERVGPHRRLVVERHPGRVVFAVELLCGIFGDELAWLERARSEAAMSARVVLDGTGGLSAVRSEHESSWRSFARRSSIELAGDDDAAAVDEAYRLHRYLLACAGRGPHPVKFNGSIFVVDGVENGFTYDADYRRWGGGYWFQNTRLMYWALLASGDFEMIRPFAEMFRRMLPLARERTKRYFGHGGVFFPETQTLWGTYLNSNYGFDRNGKHVSHVDNTYIRRYWVGAIELVAFLIDYYEYSGDETIVSDYLAPIAFDVLTFYVDHYRERSGDGKILFRPAQALETWHEAVDPLPEIVGLGVIAGSLIALSQPERAKTPVPKAVSELAATVLPLLPPIPSRGYRWQKSRELLPAAWYEDCANSENVALYAVFPFRRYGVGKPDLQIGTFTYGRRPETHLGGWSQDAIQAALLGMAREAKRCVVTTARMRNVEARFPAFWGPNFDWVPDMDHGSVLMIALQRMLLSSERDRIDVAPAWPAEWNASFRLRAHGGRTVEADIEGGAVRYLSIRSADGEREDHAVRREIHEPERE